MHTIRYAANAAADDRGMIHSDEYAGRGGDPRDLIDMARTRLLVRVRRGSYCLRSTWEAASVEERHLLRLHAVLRTVGTEYLAAGPSAAILWGLPLLDPPDETVTLLGPFRGGGRSDPGVRRITRAYARARAVQHGGFRVTDPPRTAADLTVDQGFVAGVMAFDALLRLRLADRSAIEGLRDSSGFRSGRRLVARAAAFARAEAESPGESAARAAIRLAGFEVPELQVEFPADGKVDRVDFFWRGADVAGEFDGRVKYTRQEFTGGRPEEVVWREKLREDRLRRSVESVLRITWRDVRDPQRLVRLLRSHGIPDRGPAVVSA